MKDIEKDRFIQFVRGQWAPAGYDVSEAGEAPYKELVKALPDGFSFGLQVARDEAGHGDKARVGVWFRPAPRNGLQELGALRSHYQQKLQSQGRGCRIHNCGTELGSFYLFFETTSPLPESAVASWAEMVGELSGLLFDPDALDGFLADYR